MSAPRTQRDRNLARAMDLLRTHGPASRSDIAAALGLDRSTLTRLAEELLSDGLVVEAPERAASVRGGRKPRPLAINPHRLTVLGVDVRSRQASWVLLGLDGSDRRRGRISRRTGDTASWLAHIASVTTKLVARQHEREGPVAGIGISVPGIVDTATGVVRRSVELGLEDESVASYWSDLAGMIMVANDANCCAWNLVEPRRPQNAVLAQIRLHRSEDSRFLASGAGIGIAIVIGGALYHGARGVAGELRGFRWNSGSADQLGLRLDEIQSRAGEDAALNALARETLCNLSVVVSVFDPHRVVVTGDIDRLAGPMTDYLEGPLAGSPTAELAREGAFSLVPSRRFPAADGAAHMVLSTLYESALAGGRHTKAAAPDCARVESWHEVVCRYPLRACSG